VLVGQRDQPFRNRPVIPRTETRNVGFAHSHDLHLLWLPLINAERLLFLNHYLAAVIGDLAAIYAQCALVELSAPGVYAVRPPSVICVDRLGPTFMDMRRYWRLGLATHLQVNDATVPRLEQRARRRRWRSLESSHDSARCSRIRKGAGGGVKARYSPTVVCCGINPELFMVQSVPGEALQ
jgi:hypothetical protein